MHNGPLQQPPTNDDTSRPVATSDDETAYSLTVKEAADLYEQAGFPRTLRAIQRHCKNGDLTSMKNLTLLGYEYRISAPSVGRHIAQLKQLKGATDVATIREQSRPVATPAAPISSGDKTTTTSPTSDDNSRPVAPITGDTSRYVARLESENEFLRGQVGVKDVQIKDLTERARETNHLIAGLQRMLTPLLGSRSDERQSDDVARQ
jgi:hypothetical protein